MDKRDYYEVLGVSKDADLNNIKRAYRRLAMKYHPDRNSEDPKAEDKFKEASEAFEVLSDSEKRTQYDNYGHVGVENMTGGFNPFANGSGLEDILNNLDSVFGNMFQDVRHTRTARGGAARGADLSYTLTIDLEQAVSGDKVEIEIPTLRTCKECNGSGAAAGTSSRSCPDCGGSGMHQTRQNFFFVQRTCGRCHGEGKILEKPCSRCRGQGRTQQNKTLSVSIPPGVDQDTTLRISNEGQSGTKGGPPGDLFLRFKVRPHSVFTREGNNLICEVPLTFTQAALGAEIDIPTMQGSVKLRIPAETQTGKLFRLRGRGVPALRGGGHGDLLCRVAVETPVNLTSRQRELLEELEDSCRSSERNIPKGQSFLSSMKQFFEQITKKQN